MFRWVDGRRGPRTALLLACACACPWTVAAAQERRDSTATLVVEIIDTAESPVPLADVILRRSGRQGTSGATGRVTLRNITPGLDTLLVRRLGYDPLVVAVRFFAGDTLSVEAVLDARLVALEEITVVGRPGLSTFERRMKNAIFSPPNSFYPPEALDTFPPEINVREILLRSGITNRPTVEYVRGRRQIGRMRLTCPPDDLKLRRPPQPVTIILNGIEYPDPDDVFFDIQLQNARIRALEIYRTNRELPYEFSTAVTDRACVVVVWSR